MSEIAIANETFQNLLKEVGMDNYTPSLAAEALLNVNARYIKDLKINVSNVLNNNTALSKKEAVLIALAVAINEKFAPLQTALSGIATQEGATEAEVAEVIACTSLMNTNNVFYRFRHFIKKDFYSTQPAGIKMSIMMNPILGKEFFELISIALSAVNGCERCVASHEQSVLQHGSSELRVLEAVKLAAVIKGLITVLA